MVTTAGSMQTSTALVIEFRVEAQDLIDTQFGTSSATALSLVFWAKSSIAGIYSVDVRGVVSGTVNRSFVFNFTINTANTWQRITQVIPGDIAGTWDLSSNGVGLYVDITLAIASQYQTTPGSWQAGNFLGTSSTITNWLSTLNATFQVGPRKLEVGPAPTPILRTSMQQDLAGCQRYLEKSYNLGVAIGSTGSGFSGGSRQYIAGSGLTGGGSTAKFSVHKRSGPSVVLYSTITGAAGKIYDVNNAVDVTGTVDGVGMSNFDWYCTVTAGASINLQLHWVADSRL
jgi:hypothetical protein